MHEHPDDSPLIRDATPRRSPTPQELAETDPERQVARIGRKKPEKHEQSWRFTTESKKTLERVAERICNEETCIASCTESEAKPSPREDVYEGYEKSPWPTRDLIRYQLSRNW